ncbi:MAG: roadblock/LC7 domain-containing protein [Candidatus Freyarchaeota archaeon]
MEEMMRKGSLRDCVALSVKGFVMASAEPPEFDKKRVAAAMASFILSAAKRTKSELGLEDLSDAPNKVFWRQMAFKVVDISPKELCLSALIPLSVQTIIG